MSKALKEFDKIPDSEKSSPENAPLLAVVKTVEIENAKKDRMTQDKFKF